jgi:signal transduction histidine kinase/DNA-binding NarL/FixJ family response regulator
MITNRNREKHRLFKMRWQLLIIILAVALIPLLTILPYSSKAIYDHLETESAEHYSSLVQQVSGNMDFVYRQYAEAMTNMLSISEVRNGLLAPPYRSMEEEERVGAAIIGDENTKGGLRNTVEEKIAGAVFLYELDRKSLINRTDYKMHPVSASNVAPSFDMLITDPLFLKPREENSIRMILGKLRAGSITGFEGDQKSVIIYPWYEDPPGEEEVFQKFLLVTLFPDFMDKFYRDIRKLQFGTLYILDQFDNILSTNHPGDNDYYEYDEDIGKYLLGEDEETVEGELLTFNDYQELNTDPAILEVDEVSGILSLLNQDDMGQKAGGVNDAIFSDLHMIDYKGTEYLTIFNYSSLTGSKFVYFHPISQIHKPINRILKIIAVVTLVTILLLVVLNFFLSKVITNPLKQFTEAAYKIAEGNYDVVPFKPVFKSEFSVMALAFNRMVHEMRAYSRLMEQTVKDRTVELARAREQNTFFINLAHETKTPLTLIKNYLEKYITDTGYNDDISVIKQNIDKLLRDMVNYLDAEKLRRDKVFYDHNQLLDITSLVEQKVYMFKEISRKKSITINASVDKNLFTLADPFAMDRVVNNLLDNSIKYTNSGGTIIVSLRADGDFINLSVEDNGIGMDEEQLGHIFETYHQLTHKKRNIQGIGMGLYIVHRIVDSLNGGVSVESKPGEGTTITIKLNRHNDVTGEAYETDLELSKPIEVGPVKELHEEKIVKGRESLFLVDDNIDMLYFLQSSFKDRYNIFFATSGSEALEKIEKIPRPDLIISDVMMDEMDGYEFCIRLQEEGKFAGVPFLFLTALTTEDEKIKGLNAGAVDYIYKPFLISEISAKIESIISTRKNQTEESKRQIQYRISEALKTMDHTDESGTANYVIFDDFCIEKKISPREKQVLELLIKGKLNKEISSELGISVKTVEHHIHHIYEKSGAQTRIELLNLIKP